MARIWAGVDVGKSHHHCVVIDSEGRHLVSRRVANDEPELLRLLGDVLALADEVVWAVDLTDGTASLLLSLLAVHGQSVLYLPGLAVNRAASTYRGAGKTDAKDAAVIADQARMRRDLHPVRIDDGTIAELRILTVRRADLVADRTRMVNRLRGLLAGLFPALERALDVTNHGPLILLTGYQTPAALRRMGQRRLERWLVNRKVRRAGELAKAAVDAADRQSTVVAGERITAEIVQAVAQEILTMNERVAAVDTLIADRFRSHAHAQVIESLPGIGPLLGAEFLAATGGDLKIFETPDRLAAFSGLAPIPRDSGRVSGNLRRPRRYHRGLQRVFYHSALTSIRFCPQSRGYYDRKRAEGKRHIQAVIALARRRVNVLWALLRDQRPYQPTPPAALAA